MVVDHGSTDGTLDVVRERFPAVRIVEQENRGLAAGWNRGIRETAAPFLIVLNADAWLVDDAAERLVAFAEEHERAGFVAPRLLNPDGSLQPSVRAFPTPWRLATEYLFLRKLAPRSRAERVLRRRLPARRGARDRLREGRRLPAPANGVRRDRAVRRGSSSSARRRTGATGCARRAGSRSSTRAPRSSTSAARAGGRSRRRSSPSRCAATCASSPSTTDRRPPTAPGGCSSPDCGCARSSSGGNAGPSTATPQTGCVPRVDRACLFSWRHRRCSSSRAFCRTGLGLALRLAAATGVPAAPGALLARALRLHGAAPAFALSLGAVFVALLVTFALQASLWIALAVLLVVTLAALLFVIRQGPVREWELAPGACSRSARRTPSRSGCTRWRGDALFHLARVRKLGSFDELSLDAVAEFADGGPHPGYAFPLWHGFLALMGRLAGVDPSEVLLHSAAILVPLAFVLATKPGARSSTRPGRAGSSGGAGRDHRARARRRRRLRRARAARDRRAAADRAHRARVDAPLRARPRTGWLPSPRPRSRWRSSTRPTRSSCC